MDPRFLAIEQDKVIAAAAAAAAERQDATEMAMFDRAAGTNVHFDAPWNKIFKIVFFPDRIYHAQYFNATRSPRYQYNVLEVRGRADFQLLRRSRRRAREGSDFLTPGSDDWMGTYVRHIQADRGERPPSYPVQCSNRRFSQQAPRFRRRAREGKASVEGDQHSFDWTKPKDHRDHRGH